MLKYCGFQLRLPGVDFDRSNRFIYTLVLVSFFGTTTNQKFAFSCMPDLAVFFQKGCILSVVVIVPMDRQCPSKHFLLAAAVIFCMTIPSCKGTRKSSLVTYCSLKPPRLHCSLAFSKANQQFDSVWHSHAAQDAVEIVAKAALCFDNHTVRRKLIEAA